MKPLTRYPVQSVRIVSFQGWNGQPPMQVVKYAGSFLIRSSLSFNKVTSQLTQIWRPFRNLASGLDSQTVKCAGSCAVNFKESVRQIQEAISFSESFGCGRIVFVISAAVKRDAPVSKKAPRFILAFLNMAVSTIPGWILYTLRSGFSSARNS